MSRLVIDSSALLAALFREPGHDVVSARGQDAVISAVNYAEVLTKAADRGVPHGTADSALQELTIAVLPFDRAQSRLAAALRAATRPHGLSIADWSCLALGLTTGFAVLTADRRWAEFDVGVAVEVIR